MDKTLLLKIRLNNVCTKDIEDISTIRSLSELDFYDWELQEVKEALDKQA